VQGSCQSTGEQRARRKSLNTAKLRPARSVLQLGAETNVRSPTRRLFRGHGKGPCRATGAFDSSAGKNWWRWRHRHTSCLRTGVPRIHGVSGDLLCTNSVADTNPGTSPQLNNCALPTVEMRTRCPPSDVRQILTKAFWNTPFMYPIENTKQSRQSIGEGRAI
jgi:hypothetical protein